MCNRFFETDVMYVHKEFKYDNGLVKTGLFVFLVLLSVLALGNNLLGSFHQCCTQIIAFFIRNYTYDQTVTPFSF